MRCDGATAARLRKGLGFSQQDVADKAKCSKTTIERLERGVTVDYQTIHQVAAVLGVGFNDLLQSDERGEAGPEAEFVPLTPLNSARDLMGLVLRCDTVRLDIIDNSAQENRQRVVHVLRQAEQYLPNTPRTSWDALNKWRSSAVDRLDGLSVLENILTELAGADMHMLIGEYVALMCPEEAYAAAQAFVDAMEFTGLKGSDFDPRKRVGLLHVVNTSRRQVKVRVDDLATESPDRRPVVEPIDGGDDIPF
jgi:transcriptional regulator with XRE-family HTH domain